LVRAFGIRGAAIAWAGRLVLEGTILFFLAHRLLPYKPGFFPKLSAASAGGFLALCVTALSESLLRRVSFAMAILVIVGLVGWFWGLDGEERAFMLRRPRNALANP